MTEDYIPDWAKESGPVVVDPGQYIWAVRVNKAEVKDTDREKPYVLLSCIVIEDQHAGFLFDYRLYIHKKARGWAVFFLKKFEYPTELLECEQPVIRCSAIEALQGKMLVDVYDDEKWGRVINPSAFDHYGGTEIEEKLRKSQEVQLPTDQEPAVDVESDVKEEVVDMSWLDAPEQQPHPDTGYVATDEDLPSQLFGGEELEQ